MRPSRFLTLVFLAAGLFPIGAAAEDPTSVPAVPARELFGRIDSEIAAGRFDAARDLATRILEKEPGHARAYFKRAFARLNLKDCPGAIADAGRAIELGYRYASVYNVRSACHARAGFYAEALADAEMAVSISSTSPYAYANRAVAGRGVGWPAERVAADHEMAATLSRRTKEDAVVSPLKAPQPPPDSSPKPAPKPRPAAPAAPAGAASAGPRRSQEPIGGIDIFNPGVLVLGAVGISVVLALFYLIISRMHETKRVRFGSVMNIALPKHVPAVGAVIGGRFILGRVAKQEDLFELYEARDLEDKPLSARRVFVGEMKPAEREKFMRRVQAASTIKHPAILGLSAVVEQGRYLYLVYDRPPQESLKALLARKAQRRVAFGEACGYLAPLCEAVDYIHGRDLYHGWICPGSIGVRDGACLKDFDQLPDPEAMQYQAPEAPAGTPTRESDLFALAACAYEMIVGQRPLPAAAPPSSAVKDLPSGLDAVFARALHADSGQRFHSGRELIEALRKSGTASAKPVS